MIFSSVNEDGIPKWRLILEDVKVNGQIVSVTRRLKPQPIGAIRSVQPKRTQKGVCKHLPMIKTIEDRVMYCITNMMCPCELYEPLKIKIIDCYSHMEFIDIVEGIGDKQLSTDQEYNDLLECEANREGFKTWDGLLNYFKVNKIDINKTFRIEFRKV